MGINQKAFKPHIIKEDEVAAYLDLLTTFIYNFPGSTPAQFAQDQIQEIQNEKLETGIASSLGQHR